MRTSVTRSELAATLLLLLTISSISLETACAFAPSSSINSLVPRTFDVTKSVRPLTFATTTKVQSHQTAIYASTVAPAEASNDDDGSSSGGDATVTQEIFNLVKGIVGAGVLTLPAGIAAFGSAPSAVIPAVALITVIGILSGYGFALIGRVCSLTNTTSYREAWAASISSKSSWICALSVTLKTMFAILAYSMILGDTFQALVLSAGYTWSKTKVLLGVTTFLLLPLCLLKNLSSLAPFSLLGSLGMIYTAVAMGIRYFGKAYGPAGAFATDIPVYLRPSFGTVGAAGALNAKTAILVGMLSTAYMAHFNAPKFYTELKNNTVARYSRVVAVSFFVAIVIFALMASLGFLTFGSHCSGLILNNYSVRDSLMGFSRIAVALAIVFSYPLAFTGFREGVLDLFKIKSSMSGNKLNALTVALLSFITTGALLVPDVSFVLAFAGSTLGNCLIYIFPALMFRGAIRKKKDATKSQKREVKLALVSAMAGVVMGTVGAVKAVQSIM